MDLQGQHKPGAEQGYAMAGLLVALAVMAVLMSAALPAWRHQARREKEAELIFRGQQYARAIGLWERKMGPGSRPPNFDILVQQRFLRKKYKDPMTADGEFQPVGLNAMAGLPGGPGTDPGAGRGSPPGRGRGPGASGPTTFRGGRSSLPTTAGPPVTGGQFGGGGISGVVSKSKEASIRIYNGRTHYNEWLFVHAGQSSTPGGGVQSPGPGGRGGAPRPGLPPGRGRAGPGRGTPPGVGGFPLPLPGRGRGPGQ